MVATQVGQPDNETGIWAGPYPSGAPAILADQASLCGLDVTLRGNVGDDGFGQCCLEKLKHDGVNMEAITVDPVRPTGVAFVRYKTDGSRSFIFHIAQAASGKFTGADTEELKGQDCVHIMGSSAFDDAAVEALTKTTMVARDLEIPVSFDPNVRIEILQKEQHKLALAEILRESTYVLASVGEMQLLMGKESDEECAQTLLQGNAKIVVLKKGSKGCILYRRHKTPVIIPSINVNEVDPTGAGDCFGGTFLALILTGTDPEEAARIANVAGALAVTERGPMSANRPLAQLKTL